MVIKAILHDIPAIRAIAYATWFPTFEGILSQDQIEYMLEMMYSVESLTQQIEIKNHSFFLAQENNQILGFMSVELNYQKPQIAKVHKIYVLPEAQHKGIGKLLMHKAEEVAREQQHTKLQLNVNRQNKALNFYQKLGYQILTTEDIDIGKGYLMEDYILEKEVD